MRAHRRTALDQIQRPRAIAAARPRTADPDSAAAGLMALTGLLVVIAASFPGALAPALLLGAASVYAATRD